ncbi:MAG: carboxypeptidase regulatory-like domain-containing protein [Oscillochloris sp.]|nr:carboxypeptidase regulatory-like domain-containing protein [Oscillochloris sp.]
MATATLEDGDLLAYLAGEDLPYVAQALEQSPALRQELEDLRRANQLMAGVFTDLDRPASQDLVDVITGQSSSHQQLRVAAYLRRSAAARAAYAELEQEFRSLTHAPRLRQRKLLEFLAIPAGAAVGLRAGPPAADDRDQSFVVAEISAQLTLRVVPRPGDFWAIQGYITLKQQPAAGVQVQLTAPGTHLRPRTSDEQGFFTFPRLRSGTYQLRARLEQGVLVVRNLSLDDN